jgi:hypothetical protein
MPDEEPSQPQTDEPVGQLLTAPIGLPGWIRLVLAVSGAGLLVAACWATLTADNEFGSVAIALTGGAFCLIAAMGRWPNRITWGDRSAEWAEEFIQDTFDAAHEQAKAEIVQSVITSPDPLTAQRRILHQFQREAAADRHMQLILASLPWPEGVIVREGRGRNVDFEMCRAGTSPIGSVQDCVGIVIVREGLGAVPAVQGFLVMSAGYRALVMLFKGAVDPKMRGRKVLVASLTDPEGTRAVLEEAAGFLPD